jgi:hypothetical protein
VGVFGRRGTWGYFPNADYWSLEIKRQHNSSNGKVSKQYFTETFHNTENLSEV